jgi:hypothetical protein
MDLIGYGLDMEVSEVVMGQKPGIRMIPEISLRHSWYSWMVIPQSYGNFIGFDPSKEVS